MYRLILLLIVWLLASPHIVYAGQAIRVASYNAALCRNKQGQLAKDISGGDKQAVRIAEVIKKVRPDILLINEFDRDSSGRSVKELVNSYLNKSTTSGKAVDYPYSFFGSSNTGIPTGFDLDNNGDPNGPGDAYGYGKYPGQYAMLLVSKYPIEKDCIRTFQKFLWKDMPGSLMFADYYSPEEQGVLRLSSKSHWDVPVNIDGQIIHILASHPTPPVFDGPENRNGRRNHDEIRFWLDYITAGNGSYIYDDKEERGGLRETAKFAILGDLNNDPVDGDGYKNIINELLNNKRIHPDHNPVSVGAAESAINNPESNKKHRGPCKLDTTCYPDNNGSPGNLRLDYVLASSNLDVINTGVFWPDSSDPYAVIAEASDHRLVYIDIKFK